jgi:hypothetical protein
MTGVKTRISGPIIFCAPHLGAADDSLIWSSYEFFVRATRIGRARMLSGGCRTSRLTSSMRYCPRCPWRLRYARGYDRRLCADVLAVFSWGYARSTTRRSVRSRSCRVDGLVHRQSTRSWRWHRLAIEGVDQAFSRPQIATSPRDSASHSRVVARGPNWGDAR